MFRKKKDICAEDVLLCYPDYNRPFTVHMDANDQQMGGVISQDSKAVAYWYIKWSATQHNYTTIEKKLLAMTKILM